MVYKQMSQEEINESYTLFGIPEYAIPHYENAIEFSERFEQCSVLQDINVTYSTSVNITEK